MKEILEKIRNVESECCVTIILNTHRNKPDIQKDVIMLKNLTAEAEQRLYNLYDKRLAQSIAGRIRQLAEGVDHGHNQESLLLFVNENIAETIKLPIEVEDRVVIGNTFSSRDLVRASKLQEEYYILVLSRDKARLIEAMNDQETQEVGDPFPVVNLNLYPSTDKEQSKAKQWDLLIEEFFNRVDKALWVATNQRPHPVLVCTEERNFHHFMKITDHREKIIGHMNTNRIEEKNPIIVLEAWPLILKRLKLKNKQRVNELHIAVNTGKLISDTGEIWRALNEGRGQTLFVKQGYYQPARIVNNLVEVVEGPASLEQEDIVEDIIEKMIDVNLKNGGDVVFLPEDDLKDYGGLALVARF